MMDRARQQQQQPQQQQRQASPVPGPPPPLTPPSLATEEPARPRGVYSIDQILGTVARADDAKEGAA
ncbi:Protein of unknown function [Gryllus bimaculatus]|nr:Protein of unknown function [Gryllus bimaculatus]